MTPAEVNAKLAEHAKTDPNAAVLLALRMRDPKTLAVHAEALRVARERFGSK